MWRVGLIMDVMIGLVLIRLFSRLGSWSLWGMLEHVVVIVVSKEYCIVSQSLNQKTNQRKN